MENLKRYFKKNNFAANSGIELLEVSPGYAKARMNIEEKHLNALEDCSGGCIIYPCRSCFCCSIKCIR